MGQPIDVGRAWRTMAVGALASFMIGGAVFWSALDGKPGGRIPGIAVASLLIGIGLWFVFAAIWYKVRGPRD
jgi:hypothetical protein